MGDSDGSFSSVCWRKEKVSSLSSADSGDRLRFKPGILKNVSSRARNVNGNFQQRVVLSSTSYSDASKSSISCMSSSSSIVLVGQDSKFNDQSETQLVTSLALPLAREDRDFSFILGTITRKLSSRFHWSRFFYSS